jgi:hypothetical protein
MSKTPFRSFTDREIGVSDTGSWRSQESRLFITGVPKSRNAKRRNPETGTSTKSFTDREITPFRSSGYRELEESRVETLHHRSPEVAKCETPKSRNRHINKEFRRPGNNSILEFGYRELECRNTSPQECRNAEMRKTPFGVGFGYRELECRNTSPQKSRNAEMRNCDMEFRGSRHGVSEFGASRDCDMERNSRYLITRISKFATCEMKCRKGLL